MTHDNEQKINKILTDILGSSEQRLSIDSVTYVELLIAFQNAFKIKFTTKEFLALRDVDSIKESVLSKLN